MKRPLEDRNRLSAPGSLALAATLALSGTFALAAPRAVTADGLDEVIARLDRALQRGAAFLRSRQNPDGGYGPRGVDPPLKGSSDVGLTAFALHALARAGGAKLAPGEKLEVESPHLAGAVDFILQRQQEDGSFHDALDPKLAEYRTSVAMLALITLDRASGRTTHAEVVKKAQRYLTSRQFVARHGFSRASPYYGGWGYDLEGQANLSVTKYVSEALHESSLSSGDSVWENVKVFLARAQNGARVDPVLEKRGVGTTRDGGFRYGPDFTRGPSRDGPGGTKLFSSYGSMTYSGLLSFLHARVNRGDPRVKKAFEWISRNFTLEVNPGMATPEKPELGLQGLFYYYHTMAKALSTYGKSIIVDRRGVRHDWARELGEKLAAIQKENGLWVNQASRWMERIPTLTTCYAILAMTMCREELQRRSTAAETEKK